MFANTLTADGGYPIEDWKNWHSQLKCNYLKNEKLFLNFLFYFWNLHKFLNILKAKVIIRANVFPKLHTVNILIRPLCKKRRFKKHFDSQHVKSSQIIGKSPWERFYHVFSSFWWKLIWEMSPLVLREILGVFVNTLTAEGKYPVQDWENLVLPVQNQLCGKRTTLSEFFVPFVKYT